MTVIDATSGGATQVVTTSADSTPMIAVPTNVPAFWRLLTADSRVCSVAGTWIS